MNIREKGGVSGNEFWRSIDTIYILNENIKTNLLAKDDEL